jgi:hypothetical protein
MLENRTIKEIMACEDIEAIQAVEDIRIRKEQIDRINQMLLIQDISPAFKQALQYEKKDIEFTTSNEVLIALNLSLKSGRLLCIK